MSSSTIIWDDDILDDDANKDGIWDYIGTLGCWHNKKIWVKQCQAYDDILDDTTLVQLQIAATT